MIKHLRDGLILRTLSENVASDAERLPDFYASINTEHEPEDVKDGVRRWTRLLMNGHPTVTLDDLFVVVDPSKEDMLVSATLLIPQTWRYEDVLIPVGRPELVATHPDYRSRGLVRALFEAVHERSASLGHQMQVITGIPHFYRQFGYTQAVEHAEHAIYQLSTLSDPAPDYKLAYTLRRATSEDIPSIRDWSTYFARERLLTDAFSDEVLHYEITGRIPGKFPHTDYQVIVNAEGQGVGFLILLPSLDDPYELRCTAYVVGDKSSYLATFPDVMQAVKRWAIAQYGRCPEMLAFRCGIHDVLDRLVERSPRGAIRQREYAWYVRVPDTIGFFKTISPVLERRLEHSGAHAYTGELRIGFYDLTGISLQFEAGRLTEINFLSGKDGYDASFPWHLFWNVVLGYSTWDEMTAILSEVRANPKATVLMDILFPKKKSWLRGLA